MKIRNFVHKGLKRLYEEDDAKGVPSASVDKLRKIFGFLDAMEDIEELHTLSSWKPHLLTGNRSGTWSLHITRNWRITFWVDGDENEIRDLMFEDYH